LNFSTRLRELQPDGFEKLKSSSFNSFYKAVMTEQNRNVLSKKTLISIAFVLGGMIFFFGFSTLSKLLSGSNLYAVKGHIVPLSVGSLVGLIMAWGYSRIHNINLELKKRVDRRTAELKNSNTQLKMEIKEREKAENEKEELINELQNALDDIKTLSGLLPICASCKKIRDDKGYWNQIEDFISSHTNAKFTHGICSDCAEKIYPGHDIGQD